MDNVNHPKHYTECSLECFQVMKLIFGDRMVSDFCLCNAFKYMWRYQYKNGKEDLQKADWYLARVETLGLYREELQKLKQLRKELEG